MNKPVLLATDGSCLRNPGGATGWAWVTADGRWAAACAPTGTNQTAELWAVLIALRDFPTEGVIIQIDSAYAMNCAEVWAPSWARKGWRNGRGERVANLALVRALHLQMTRRREAGLKTRFQKVPGHDPHNRYPLNTQADERARDAARYARRTGCEREFTQGILVTP